MNIYPALRILTPKRFCPALLAGVMSLLSFALYAQDDVAPSFKGDIGIGWMREERLNPSASREHQLIPYIYGEWGRWFARVDTFGLQTVPLGAGYLEVVYRNSSEGQTLTHSQTRSYVSRANPQLWGIGTFQETNVGGFFIYGLHDTRSQGQLYEMTYALEFQMGGVKLYPQFGIEHRSATYVNKLYGVSAAEAVAQGIHSYNAPATTSYVWSLALELPLQAQWNVEWELSHTRLGNAISQSPLVGKSTTVSNLIALVRRF